MAFGYAIEPKNKEILALNTSKEINMFVAERFLSTLLKNMGNIQFPRTDILVPTSIQFLKLKHHIFIPLLRKELLKGRCSISKIELKISKITFLVKMKNCKLRQVHKWLWVFVDYHNKELEIFK